MKASKISLFLGILLVFLTVASVSATDVANTTADSSASNLAISDDSVNTVNQASNVGAANVNVTSSVSDNLATYKNNAISDEVSTYASSTHNVNSTSYSTYFEDNGTIKNTSGLVSGDTLTIDTINGKNFVINIPLTITGTTSSSVISNGTIHLTDGSSGSTLTGLTLISNTTNGIWLSNSNNNTITNCSVECTSSGIFTVAVVNSSNNLFKDSSFKSGSSSCFVLGGSNYNTIANSTLVSTGANVVYVCYYSFADYVQDGKPGSNNQFIGNTISAANSALSYGFSIMGNNNSVINNTVNGGSIGVNIGAENNTVTGNTINNSAIGISAPAGYVNAEHPEWNTPSADNAYIAANTITSPTNGTGISVSSKDSIVLNNTITGNPGYGIYVNGANNQFINNNIYDAAVGINLATDANSTTISGNSIKSKSGNGIIIGQSSNNTINKNSIEIVNNETIDGSTVVGIFAYGDSNNNKITENNVTINITGNADYSMYAYGIEFASLDLKFNKYSSPANNTLSSNNVKINSLYYANGIYISNAVNSVVNNNNVVITSDNVAYGLVMEFNSWALTTGVEKTNNTNIFNNSIAAESNMVYLIENFAASNSTISNNILNGKGEAVYGIAGDAATGDKILANNITITGNDVKNVINKGDAIKPGQAGVYYTYDSSDITIENNRILSNYAAGGDYAVNLGDTASSTVVGNYLVSNVTKNLGDAAVNASANTTAVINNTPATVDVILTADDFTTFPVSGKNFTAKLTDILGNPISGQEVSFNLFNALGQNKTYWATTNTEGVAKLPINLAYPSNYTMLVNFGGKGNYSASATVNATIVIGETRNATVLNASNFNTSRLSGQNFTATLKDNKGNVLVGQDISFTLVNAIGQNKTYWATTNTEGVAKLPINLAYPSVYFITSSFAGHNDYGPSNSVTSTVTITA